ncbi:MAG TPA: hypothetical protein VJI68_00625 [Candidatus Nanoarchaeia archaeon]|nr:hypothetical protein [Candidatus Nanoarchaeia archaeon]
MYENPYRDQYTFDEPKSEKIEAQLKMEGAIIPNCNVMTYNFEGCTISHSPQKLAIYSKDQEARKIAAQNLGLLPKDSENLETKATDKNVGDLGLILQ